MINLNLRQNGMSAQVEGAIAKLTPAQAIWYLSLRCIESASRAG